MTVVEATKLDTAASDSCTRAGIFALLLSLVLVALIPYWAQEREEIALGRYLALRLNLATSINQLDTNHYWQKYKTSHEEAESMSIEQLLEVHVEISSSKAHVGKAEPAPFTTVENEAEEEATLMPSPPSPPAGLRMSIQIDTIGQVATFLRDLNDAELLTTSRKVSSFYDYSIYLWALERDRLITRNKFSEHPDMIIWSTADKTERPEYFVPARAEEELLKYLTLQDVRELSQFELPKISNTTILGRRSGKEIDITPGSLPRDLYMAVVFAETLLLFVIMYFYAFTRVAVSSVTFPAPGTLFNAYAQSPLTLVVFFIALWSPVVASLGMVIASRKLPLIVYSVVIGCAVLSVHLALQRKSFFKVRNFRGLIHSKLPEKETLSKDVQASSQDLDLSTALPNKQDAGDAEFPPK